MTASLAALLGWIAVGLLPGYALVRLLDPRAGRLGALAFGPLTSLGIVLLTAQVATPSASFGPALAWLTVAASGAVAVVAEWRDRRVERPVPDPRLGWLIAAGPILAAGIAIAGVPGVDAAPPSDDGINHGIMTRLVERTGGIDPAQVLLSDVPSGERAADYYPLAFHALAAQVRWLSGASVETSLTVSALGAVLVMLPLGVGALARRVFGLSPRGAALAGVVSVVVPMMPWAMLEFGLLPFMIGLAAVPLLVERVHAYWGQGREWVGSALVLVAGLGGMVGVHVVELIPVAVAVVAGWSLDSALRAPARRVLARSGVLVLGTALWAWPQLIGLSSAAAERSGLDASEPNVLSEALGLVLLLALGLAPPVASWLIAVYGGALWVAIKGPGRGWLAAMAVFASLFIWVHTTASDAAAAAATPWYGGSWRIMLVIDLLAIPIGGVGVVVAVRSLKGLGGRRGWSPWAGDLLAVLLVAAVVLPGAAASASAARSAYSDRGVLEADERRAIAYLSAQVSQPARVLNEPRGGMRWMYSLGDVDPVFGFGPDAWADPAWTERFSLLDRFGSAGVDPDVDSELNRWSIDYLVVGDRLIEGTPRRLSNAVAAGSPGWREVFRSGEVVVYQRVFGLKASG